MYMRCTKISNTEFFLLGKSNKTVIEKFFAASLLFVTVD